MRSAIAFQLAVLLVFPFGAISAEVHYQHPDLTIVADDEPLDSVLKSISKEMRIFVTTPTGLNPVINCDIQAQPVKLAFKKLLGDMSYSLQWKDGGERLAGLTILSGTGDAVAVTADSPSAARSATRDAGLVIEHHAVPDTARSAVSGGDAAETPVDDSAVEVATEEREARIAEEAEAREIEMELRRQEEVIAHEARMEEERVRNEAEMAEYFEANGINPNP
ncbi:MAG: hypothetical protein KDI33_00805 [Halioglobus sp.]|nr:hypothetical protein [Halioglobus sp.]